MSLAGIRASPSGFRSACVAVGVSVGVAVAVFVAVGVGVSVGSPPPRTTPAAAASASGSRRAAADVLHPRRSKRRVAPCPIFARPPPPPAGRPRTTRCPHPVAVPATTSPTACTGAPRSSDRGRACRRHRRRLGRRRRGCGRLSWRRRFVAVACSSSICRGWRRIRSSRRRFGRCVRSGRRFVGVAVPCS